MQVSVVVPTRDRPAALARCLAALATPQADDLELVVVDDGSRDRGAVEAAGRASGARVVRTPGRGPAAARNLGARAAAGDVVCFTDDDCVPEPGWAAALAAATSRTGVAAGRTVSPPGAPAPVRASQAIVEHLQVASLAPADGLLAFAPSCNIAATREALARLPFDESFPSAAGEDRDWSARAVGAALAPAYAPDAVVVHHQRLGGGGFLRQQYRYGRGAARFRRGDGERRLAPAGFYAALLRRGFAEGAAVGGLVAVAQLATAAGVLAERFSRSAT
jgi:glycosyltransferase involved in cell wall biosynthesis